MRHSQLLLALLLSLVLGACTAGKKGQKAHQPGPKQAFETRAGDFSIRPPGEMRRLGKDSVPWATVMPSSDQNGVVAYFFGKGASVALASPHIRIEYLSRNMEGAETTDRLFDWLKGLFLNPERNGKLLSEGKTITTADGQSVPYLEIAIPQTQDPNDPERYRSAKHMIWAYIPLNDDYFIAVNGTTVDPQMYPSLKKDFIVTIASFKGK